MIDFLKIKTTIGPYYNHKNGCGYPLIFFGLNFDPIYRNGQVVKYVTKLENLHICLRGDELSIQNSLTKFNYGNNYTNLAWTQVQQTITRLENQLGIPLRDARVISFEFGVVIEDNNIPLTLSRLGHYKGHRPIPMHTKVETYGIRYENSTHKLKIYNKTSEVRKRERIKLDGNYLRVEKCYTRSHLNSLVCLKGNPINTLDDLASLRTLEILSDDLIRSLAMIELNPVADLIEGLSPKNIRRVSYLKDPYMRNYMKERHLKAFKIDRREVNKIWNECNSHGQNMLIEEVKNKLDFCLNN